MADSKRLITLSLFVPLILLGGFFRLFRIDKSPDSLSWDEAALGYNAYSLFKTGRDEYAKPIPTSLRSFDDYKPALYSYLIVPFFLISEPNDIVVRLPSAIFGILLIILVFDIVYTLSSRRSLSFLSAFFFTIAAWDIHFSRMAFETHVATGLLYLGIALLLRTLKKNKPIWLPTFFVILSMYTYHSPRAIAIPVAVSLILLFSSHRLRDIIRFMSFSSLLLIPLAINFVTDPITARLTGTNIFKLWPFVPKEFPLLIYNPIYTLLWNYAGRFFAYFSPVNLFIKGSNEFNLFTPTLGLFMPWEMPFWLAGWTCLAHNRLRRFILPLIILAPLPGVITWNWFSEVRTTALYPVFSILTAFGLLKLWNSRFKLLLVPTSILAFLSILYMTTTELIFSPALTFAQNPPGFEQSASYIFEQAKNYKQVVFDSSQSSPHIMLLFYGRYDPRTYQNLGGVYKNEKYDGITNYGFDKFQFRRINWSQDKFLKDTLFVGPVTRLPEYEFTTDPDFKILKDVVDLQGYTSFRIVGRKTVK